MVSLSGRTVSVFKRRAMIMRMQQWPVEEFPEKNHMWLIGSPSLGASPLLKDFYWCLNTIQSHSALQAANIPPAAVHFWKEAWPLRIRTWRMASKERLLTASNLIRLIQRIWSAAPISCNDQLQIQKDMLVVMFVDLDPDPALQLVIRWRNLVWVESNHIS